MRMMNHPRLAFQESTFANTIPSCDDMGLPAPANNTTRECHSRSRSPVLATRAAVSSSQPEASRIGLEILKAGGNAADACVAMAAALNVTEPTSTGIGGDCFAIFYNARTRQVAGLNGSGRAPAALSLERCLQAANAATTHRRTGKDRHGLRIQDDRNNDECEDDGGACLSFLCRGALKPQDVGRVGRITVGNRHHRALHCEQQPKLPSDSALNVTVPGAAAGWCDALTAWGSMPLEAVLRPAIQLAERGFAVAPIAAGLWKAGESKLLHTSNPHGAGMLLQSTNIAREQRSTRSAAAMSAPQRHRAPRAGELFRNPALAETFKILARDGARGGFYTGRVGEAIVATTQAAGGVLALEDLVAHTSTFVNPVSVRYGGVDIWEIPPNGQGITALMALQILKGVDMSRGTSGPTPRAVHYQIDAMRLAFADARAYIADPDFCNSTSLCGSSVPPLHALLSEEYACTRRSQLSPNRALAEVMCGRPHACSDTVSFCCVDAYGNACSFINSNYEGFGTGLVPQDCGFTLQNRGANFVLQRHHPNVVAPCKRPYHTIIPGMATRAGTLWAPFSVMGGFMQPQGHVQVICNMLDWGMNPQQALDAPRFCLTGEGELLLEQGFSERVVDFLTQVGHQRMRAGVSGFERRTFGRGQIIRRAPNGVLWCGSDLRADGMAMGM